MKSLLIVCFFLIASVVYGQKYASVGEKDGKKYYIHKVEANNSLFGISKTYEISAEEIQRLNPQLADGLQIGQDLWIPVRYYDHVHIAQNSETIYGISKQYSISIESLIAQNSFLTDGLKEGQQVVIKNLIMPILLESAVDNPFSSQPKELHNQVEIYDSIMEYVVHPGETLYSISRRFMVSMDTLISRNKLLSNALSLGQKILIPLKKELEVKPRNPDVIEIEDITSEPLESDSVSFSSIRRIAVFLPFNLDTLDYRKVRPKAMEYYMGALLAIDSLKKYGVNCEFHFIDYESKKKPFDSVLASDELEQMDLVFAPFNRSKAQRLKVWSEDKTTKIVFPLNNHNKLFDGAENNYFLEANSSILDYNLAKHLSNLDSAQLVFIKTKDSIDLIRQNQFLTIFYNLDSSAKLIESNPSNYKYFSNKRKVKTIYILLSKDKDIVEELLTFCNEKKNVLVYGMSEWIGGIHYVKSIENTTPFNFADEIYLSYSDSTLKSVHRMYRWKFNSDMTKFSCKGYDATLNVVLHALYDISLPNGLIHKFMFEFNKEGTRQNMGAYILNFNNLEITKLE